MNNFSREKGLAKVFFIEKIIGLSSISNQILREKNLFRKKISVFSLLIFFFSFSVSHNVTGQASIEFSGYLGGTGADAGNSVAVVDDVVHILGSSGSSDFPVTDGSTLSGTSDLVYIKTDTLGNILFAGYIGGGAADTPIDMEVINDEVYIMGTTSSSNFPVTDGSSLVGSNDIFYAKLNNLGQLVFASYLGGSGTEKGNTMEVVNGEAYILLSTNSTDFPVTNGSTFTLGFDLVYVKFDSTPSLEFSTYLGGSGDEFIADVKVLNDEVHILGLSNSPDFGVMDGTSLIGGQDFVYVKYDSGNNITLSRYVGGSGNEDSGKLAFDGSDTYIFGKSGSLDYPVTDGSTHSGSGNDLVLTKLNSSGVIVTALYLGGTGNENPGAIEFVNNEIHLFGITASSDFPITNGSTHGGSNDYFYSKLNTSGSLLFSTYVGGSGSEFGSGAKIMDGNVYLYGYTTSTDYPIKGGRSHAGGSRELVFTKFDQNLNLSYSTFLGGAVGSVVSVDFDVLNDHAYLVSHGNPTDFPTTNGGSLKGTRDFMLSILNLCPTGYSSVSTVSPSSQTICQNGLVTQITAEKTAVLSTNLPTLYITGIASPQSDIEAYYQWQEASAAMGPWSDILGATQKNYSPPPSVSDRFFRRIGKVSDCCGGTNIDTTDVASVLVTGNISPTADGGGIFNTCPGTSVTLGGSPTASGGASPYMYAWTEGSSSTIISTAANPTVTPAISGSVIYTVTVTDNNGCEHIDQAIVNVYEAYAGPDVGFCEGTSGVQIGGTPIAGLSGVTYSWSPGTDLSCTNCAQPIADPSTTTVYTLTLTIPVTGGGTCQTMDAVTVAPVAAPTTSNFAGADVTICIGDTGALGEPAEAGFSYTWAPGNYLTANNSAQTTFQPGSLSMPTPNPITYYVTAEKDGCVFVDETVAAVIEARAGDDGCGPRYVGEPDRTPDISETYSWVKISGTGDFTGVTNLQQVPVSATPSGSTTYELTVTYNSHSCVDQVVVPPCGCTLDVDVEAPFDCPDFGLNGGDVKLIARAADVNSNDPDLFTYSWSPQEGLSAYTGREVYLTDDVARTYTVTMTSPFDPTFMCTDMISVNNPAWSLPVFNTVDTTICSNEPVQLGEPTVAGYSYEWSGQTLSDDMISDPIAMTLSTANFFVTITDVLSGCITKDTSTLTIPGVIANAGPDISVCDNGVITIGTAAVANATYSWSPPMSNWQNGTDETHAQPEALVAINTTFTVTVTDTPSGCTSTDDMEVIVGTPISSFTLPTLSYCPDDLSALTLGSTAPTGGGLTYQWSPASLVSDSEIAMPTVNDPKPGTETEFDLIVRNTDGCEQRATQTITPTGSSFTAGSNQSMCAGETISLGSASNPTGGITYSWSPTTNLSSSTSPNPTFSTTTAGTYEFTLTKSESGCDSDAEVTITVNEYSLPAISSLTVCDSSCVEIGTTPEFGVQYFWNPTTFLSDPSIANPTVCPTATTSYTLTATGTNGCSDMADIVVGVNPVPAPQITIPALSECLGATGVTFNPSVSPSATYNYVWSPNDGTLSDIYSSMPVVSLTGVGSKTYDLTVTNTSTGCTGTAEGSLNVNYCNCNIESIILSPGGCQPSTNTYDLDIVISYSNSPGGDLTINVGGTDYTLTSNGSGSENFTITGLEANGATDVIVTATFVNDSSCSLSSTFNAPENCDCGLDILTFWSDNCMENGTGGYIADWNIGISAENTTETDISYQRNSESVQSHTLTGTTDTLMFSGIPADGGSYDTLKVWFTNETTCGDTIIIKRPVPCPTNLGSNPGEICSSVSNTEIKGTVFEDWNYDGVMNQVDTVGVQGVQVQVYDCDNILIDTTYTDSNGNFEFTGLTAGQDYRVEFNFPEAVSCWAKPTQAGANNGTTVQFVQPGNCASLGVSSPSDFCETNPRIALACYESGDASANSNPGLVSFSYNASGLPSNYTGGAAVPGGGSAENPVVEAMISDLGTVNGTAWQAAEQRLFMSSFLKRFSAFRQGPGYVYVTQFVNGSATGTSNFNLDGLTPANGGIAIDLGTVCRGGGCEGDPGNTGFASDYELAAIPTQQSIDLDGFAKVGTMSYGDADLSEDGKTLWLVNLNQKALISVDVSVPTGSLPGTVNQYLLSDLGGVPSCGSTGVLRPWGLAFEKGMGYLGVVCDASVSQNTNDLTGYILSFDPNNISGGFTTVLEFDLDYNREIGQSSGNMTPTNMNWKPWAFDWATLNPFQNGTDDNYMAPQPIICDIDFNEKGDMIIGMMDRFGHQNGRANFIAVSQTSTTGDTNAGGDIIQACFNGSGYDIEGTGICTVNDNNVTGDVYNQLLQNDGAGNAGEFYYEDYFSEDTTDTSVFTHGEVFNGNLDVVKGKKQVIGIAYDPLWGPPRIVNSQGVVWYNTYTGEKMDGYQVVESSDGSPSTFAKANGLGDLQSMCSSPPIEIGNYVWEDTDGDGIQDACEPGISGVTIQLYDNSGNLKATTTTDVNGQYYFSHSDSTSQTWASTPDSVEANTSYYLVIGSGQFSDSTLTINSANYTLTIDSTDSGSNRYVIDSDAEIVNSSPMNAFDNLPATQITTGDWGCIDHGFDFGFTPQMKIGNFVWTDFDKDGIQDSGEPGVEGVQIFLYTALGTKVDSALTNSGGFYEFCVSDTGSYYLDFNIGNAWTITAQDQMSNDTIDSDINTSTKRTAPFTLAYGDSTLLFDAGVYACDYNVFVTGHIDNQIHIYDDAGTLLNTVTSGGGTFNQPNNMACGPDGNIYISDFGNDRVMRFSPDGTYINDFINDGVNINGAENIAFAPNGEAFVVSWTNQQVNRYDADGNFLNVVADGSDGLTAVQHIDIDPQGRIYIGIGNDIIRRFWPDGTLIDDFITEIEPTQTGITSGDFGWGPDGNFYVLNRSWNNLNQFSADGTFLSRIVDYDAGGLTTPIGFAFSPDGNIYIGSGATDNVKIYNGTTGAYISDFMSSGANSLNEPFDVKFVPVSDCCEVTIDTFFTQNCTNTGADQIGNLSVVVSWTDAPSNEDINVTLDGGNMQTIPVSTTGTSPDTVTISGLAANSGFVYELIASFATSVDCADTTIAYIDCPIICDEDLNSYAVSYENVGWVNPTGGTSYPYTQTFSGVLGSKVDMSVTLPRAGQDNNHANPGCGTACQFGTEITTYYESGDILRYWKQNDTNADTMIVNFSKPVILDTFLFGGQRPPSGGTFAVAEITFWDGPNGTGNKVGANPAKWSDVSLIDTITVENPLSNTAPINILTGTTSGAVTMGDQKMVYHNGTFYSFGKESGRRPWSVLNLDSVYVQSITWTLYASSTDDPATANSNRINSGNLSAYIGGFRFVDCETDISCSLPDTTYVMSCDSTGSIEIAYAGLLNNYSGSHTLNVPVGTGNVTKVVAEALYRTHTGVCQPTEVFFAANNGMTTDTCQADSVRLEIPVFNNDWAHFDGKIYRAEFTGDISSVELFSNPTNCEPVDFVVYAIYDGGGSGVAQSISRVDGFVGAIQDTTRVKVPMTPSPAISDYNITIPFSDISLANGANITLEAGGVSITDDSILPGDGDVVVPGPGNGGDLTLKTFTLTNVPANTDSLCITMVSNGGSSWFIANYVFAEASCIANIDLSLDKTVDNSVADIGETVTFTLIVQNAGPSVGTGIQVTDQLPSGLMYISDNGGGDYNSGTGIWTVNNLAVGESDTLTISAEILGAGSYNNCAEITAANENDIDSDPTSNAATDDLSDGIADDDEDCVLVQPNLNFDLSLDKHLSVGQTDTVDLGDDISYTIVITNEGDVTARNTVICDILPPGLIISPNDTSGWTGTAADTLYHTISDPIAPGNSDSVTIILKVRYGGSGVSLVNTAEIFDDRDSAGNGVVDEDSEPNNGDKGEDDIEDEQIVLLDHDPTGYIYCDKTGKVVTGGTISVMPPSGVINDPTQVNIVQDGSNGYYEWYATGPVGNYTISYSHPDGHALSPVKTPTSPLYMVPTAPPNITLGSDTTGMYLTDTSFVNNPYYLAFEIEVGDAFVFLNNLPVTCVFIGSIICEDDDLNDMDDGNEPALSNVLIRLYDCADTTMVLDSTYTDVNGYYRFDGLAAGMYRLQVVDPSGYRIISSQADTISADGFFSCTNLALGECDTTKTVCFRTIPYDWGDLPDGSVITQAGDYQTTSANNGPRHEIISGLLLGASVDEESDGQQSPAADGDGADEDGFTFPNTLNINRNVSIRRPISITNTTGTTAHLEAWIDWNGDGDFDDSGEMIADLSDDGAGNFGVSVLTINVPSNATQNQALGVRFRLSHTDNMTPYGQVDSGEVEDYLISVGCPLEQCLPATIQIDLGDLNE